jgi:hypothetical protein
LISSLTTRHNRFHDFSLFSDRLECFAKVLLGEGFIQGAIWAPQIRGEFPFNDPLCPE